MSLEIYSFDVGVVADEQLLVTAIDTFLTSTIGGWTRIETVADDPGNNRDYAWSSPGELPDYYDTIYIRMRGQSDKLYLYGYGWYTDSSTFGDEIYNVSRTYLTCGSVPIRYWLVGNKDFIQVHITNYSTNKYYVGYAGLIKSYYVPETDPYPLLIKGQYTAGAYWSNIDTSFMHNPTTSGESVYVAHNWNTTTLNYDIGIRTNDSCILPVVLYSSTASNEEVRGEPYGVYQVNGKLVGHMTPMTSASGTFITFKIDSNDTKTYAYGPIASGIQDLSLW